MLKPPVNKKDNSTGQDNAAITLVEYGDYECPHCGHAHPIIKSILQKMEGQLRFVFRNFPLQEAHPHALIAALATEAAARQAAFWPMHDIIFENQETLSYNDLKGYAAGLKLDIKTFEADIKNEALATKVDDDMESGVRSGVNGTPSFFVNGEKYNGSWEEEEFLEYLQTFIS